MTDLYTITLSQQQLDRLIEAAFLLDTANPAASDDLTLLAGMLQDLVTNTNNDFTL